MKTYATIFVLALLLGCGGGQGIAPAPAPKPPAPKPPAPLPTPQPPTATDCPPLKVGPIWASDPATGAVIVPVSVDADGTPHYVFQPGQQVQFHAPVTGGC